MIYTLINKRLGIHMIGGVSTLFLNKNGNILSFDDSYGNKTVIGKPNNLNSLSFSSNLGFGIGYKITQRFEIHMEPIFKYQINAYSDITDFEPYIFGVYTGLSFKF